jgi:hypothetical protein
VRSLVLILMIALLPLRMWASEGMAIQMAAHGQQSSAMPADGPAAESAAPMSMAGMSTEAMDDCPMGAEGHNGSPAEQSKGSAASCLTCQLCAALAALPVLSLGSDAVPGSPTAAVASRFDSADPVRERKPPIS